MTEPSSRIETWLAGLPGLAGFRLQPAAGDASVRRYQRVLLPDGASLIAMDASALPGSVATFVELAERLARIGLHTPEVIARADDGLLLLADLGRHHYLDALDEASVERLYGDALGALLVLQACAPTAGLPRYDRALLARELAIFRDWLLGPHLGIVPTAAEAAMLEALEELLIANALAQPQCFVHRDFHSRNLMVARPNPGILDFQDAVVGPLTYDLVSLLKDCYIAWPRARVVDWSRGYFELAVQSGVIGREHEADFIRWFDLMGAQRHLKAAGIFARLWRRDRRPGYLADIPRTLGYVVELGALYPELAPAAAWIERTVLPRLADAGR